MTTPIPAGDRPEPGPPPLVTSRELLGKGRELQIQHGTDRYRLCLTSTNKLILIK